jgi:hypothetical protein
MCVWAGWSAGAAAAVHLWKINEVYSNADGTIQYIELTTSFDFQNIFSGTSLTSTNGTATQSVTFNQNTSTATANKTYLIGTPGFAALNLVTPDFTIPAGFLYLTNGTVNFGSFDSATYTSLPTDGTTSLNRASFVSSSIATQAVNSPKNFAGQMGGIVLPNPPTVVFASSGYRQAFLGVIGNVDISQFGFEYVFTCQSGAHVVSVRTTKTTANVLGLNNGQMYSCQVSSRNRIGTGPPAGFPDIVVPSDVFSADLRGGYFRATHGVGQSQSIVEFPVGIDAGTNVEPRDASRDWRLVLIFSARVANPGTITLRTSNDIPVGMAAVELIDNEKVVVRLSGAPENVRLKLVVESPQAVNGSGTNGLIEFSLQGGDVNLSRRVTASDVAAMKARLSQRVDVDNARFDLDRDGFITSSDVSIAKSRSGLHLN